eukprot:863242-Amphidinium_carterae.1
MMGPLQAMRIVVVHTSSAPFFCLLESFQTVMPSAAYASDMTSTGTTIRFGQMRTFQGNDSLGIALLYSDAL